MKIKKHEIEYLYTASNLIFRLDSLLVEDLSLAFETKNMSERDVIEINREMKIAIFIVILLVVLLFME